MERVFGPFTLRIDLTLCVGFGDCIDEGGGILELTEEGTVRFSDGAPVDVPHSRLLAACTSCPVDALSLHDAAGRQVGP